MATIKDAVGDWSKPGVANNWEDVYTVQKLLKQAAKATGKSEYDPYFADGIIFPFASRTVGCIRAFQARFMSTPDGVVSPGRTTIRTLSEFENSGSPAAPGGGSGHSGATVNGAGCGFPLKTVPAKHWRKPKSGHDYRGRYFGALRWSKKQNGFRKHAGVDLIVPMGTPIFAVDDGEVHWVSEDFYSGKRDNGEEWVVGAVTVIHRNFTVRYAETTNHKFVKNGEAVAKGQKIAEVGKMSRSSMVHFEMYSSNTAGGRLSDRSQKATKEFDDSTPFQRRKDLIDPSSYLDSWKGNLPS